MNYRGEESKNEFDSLTVADISYPIVDGSVGQVLTTDGAGVLTFTTVASGGAGTLQETYDASANGAITLDATRTKIQVKDAGVSVGDLFDVADNIGTTSFFKVSPTAITHGAKQLIADGTVSIPSIAFSSENNTGIYTDADTNFGVSVLGIRSLGVRSLFRTTLGSNAGLTAQGTNSTLIGAEAGKGSAGDDTTAVGYQALTTSSGIGSTAFGSKAGMNAGVGATLFGYLAGSSNAQNYVVAMGESAGQHDAGTQSVSVGFQSNIGNVNPAGHFSIGVGSLAKSPFNNSIAIGYQATTTAVNQCVIGNSTLALIRPEGNGVCDLGDATHSFKYIHTQNGLVSSTLSVGHTASPENSNRLSLVLNNGAESIAHFGLAPNQGMYITAKSQNNAGILAGAKFSSNTYICKASTGDASMVVQDGGNIFLRTDNSLTPDAFFTPTTRLFISNAGRVGINTASPTNLFDITTGATTDSAFHLGESLNEGFWMASKEDNQCLMMAGSELVVNSHVARSTSACMFLLNAGQISFRTNTGLVDGNSYVPTERMVITNTGDVGVGTASPSARFEVEKTNTATSGTDYNNKITTSVSAPSNSTAINYGVANLYSISAGASTYDKHTGVMSDMTHNGTGAITSLFANSSLITNASTANILDSYGYHSSITNSSSGQVFSHYHYYATAPTNPTGTISDSTGLFIADQSTATQGYGIRQLGRTTINLFEGETVCGSDNLDAYDHQLLVSRNTSDAKKVIKVQNIHATHTGALIFGNTAGTGVLLQLQQGGSDKFSVSNTGVVNVSGLTASSDVLTDGSSNLTTSSDIRTKKDIKPVEYGLDEIMKINPILFRYKTDPDGCASNIGFSAQNVVEAGIPEGAPCGKDGYYGLNSRGILATLVNAVKELKKENDELKSLLNKVISVQTKKQKEKINEMV